MTQKEKQLLLQDLCARLPYGVMVGYSTKDNPNTLDKIGEIIYVDIRFGMIQMQVESGISYGLPPSEFIKPYLRPMSSMTEEECMALSKLMPYETDAWKYIKTPVPLYIANIEQFDFFHRHHLDWRGLISKGLAIEASEGMYNNKMEE